MEKKPRKRAARRLPPHQLDAHMDVLNITGMESEEDLIIRLASGALVGPPRPLVQLLFPGTLPGLT
jgi:hypothetical protein